VTPQSGVTSELTFYYNGLDRRLTDVHGHLIQPIMA